MRKITRERTNESIVNREEKWRKKAIKEWEIRDREYNLKVVIEVERENREKLQREIRKGK